jgi:hypothetical protein
MLLVSFPSALCFFFAPFTVHRRPSPCLWVLSLSLRFPSSALQHPILKVMSDIHLPADEHTKLEFMTSDVSLKSDVIRITPRHHHTSTTTTTTKNHASPFFDESRSFHHPSRESDYCTNYELDTPLTSEAYQTNHRIRLRQGKASIAVELRMWLAKQN